MVHSINEEYIDTAISLIFIWGVLTDYLQVSYADDEKKAFLTFTPWSPQIRSLTYEVFIKLV